MFNLKFVLAFIAVVEQGSFTKAAARLATSQSWISEQVKKLEEQVGFQLLYRTSRKMELTSKGEEFARLAREFARASDALDIYVRSTRTTQQGSLKVGSVVAFAELPQRTVLFDTFMRLHRRIDVEVIYGHEELLFEKLSRFELDVVMAFDLGAGFPGDLDVLTLAVLDSYILVPQEDPVAGLESFPGQAFTGRSIVTVPRNSSGPMIDHMFSLLEKWGIDWVPAPEDGRRQVERAAQARRMSTFRWRPPGHSRRRFGDMVQLPLETPMTATAVLVRNRNLASRNTDRLWSIARDVAARGAGSDALRPQMP